MMRKVGILRYEQNSFKETQHYLILESYAIAQMGLRTVDGVIFFRGLETSIFEIRMNLGEDDFI